MEKKQLATWPNGGNFHEFAFGLHPRRRLLLPRPLQRHQQRRRDDRPAAGPRTAGTCIKIDRKNVAGLDRSPAACARRNGIGFGPEDGIFVNDNQGAWLPANKMVQIKQDRFFNHYTNPPGPLDTKPVTQPVLWMPHNEIAQLADANPVLIKDGPVQGPDDVGRRHLRRPAARLPREGRGRVPGRRLPPLGRPRGRRQPHDHRPGRLDLRRRHRRGRQLGRGQQAPLRPPEAQPERQERLRLRDHEPGRGRLQAHLHAAGRRHGDRAPEGRLQVRPVALRADLAVRRPEGRRGDPDRQGRHDLRRQEGRHAPRRRPQARPRRARALAAPVRLAAPARSCGTPRRGTRSTRSRATSRRSATGPTSSRRPP